MVQGCEHILVVSVAAVPNSVRLVLAVRKLSLAAVHCSAVAVFAVADILAVLGCFAADSRLTFAFGQLGFL